MRIAALADLGVEEKAHPREVDSGRERAGALQLAPKDDSSHQRLEDCGDRNRH